MALVVKDRVKELTTTTGTADFLLAGAVTGFQAFSVLGNGNTTYYAAVDPATGDWEVGVGTYSSTGPTLTRDTVLESSNAGSKVSFAAGSKDVFVTYPAERSVYLDAAGLSVTALDVNTLGVGTANITTANITAGTISTTPTIDTDLVNKQYVDTMVATGISFHQAVKYEVPLINLNATYNNGTAGVGATLTNAGTLTAFTPDGTVASVGDRILVYNQTNAAQNGVYTVTTVGSGSVAWVLTRATDADTYGNGPNALDQGATFFITSGATGAGESYTCNTIGTITFGTTPITFAQISDTQIYSAGTGLTLTGTEFSITPVGTAATYGSASQVPVLTTNASGQVTSVTNTPIAISSSAVSGLAPSATTDTTNAANITSGTLPSGRLSGAYTGLTGVGTLAAGTWNAGTIAAAYGGTGQSSYTVGDLLYADSSSSLAKLADVAYGNVLLSGGVGTAPSYGKVSLTDHITGTLAVSNGGTGATTLTGYVYGNGTGAFTASTSIPNSATTATSANTASAIVARDASGNFSAGTITAALSGNATSATSAGSVTNAVTFNNGGAGDASGTTYNGSAAKTISYNTVGAPSTTGTNASGTWGINISGNAATATSATSSGSVTNSVTFNNSGAGDASGTAFNGGAARTISYNTIGAPSTTGTNASGTWGINVTGLAGSVAASTITGQVGMWTSTNRPGPYRLYRNDSDDPYNIQATWSVDRSGYWSLRGYYNDSYHAACYVAYSGYADSAGSAGSATSAGYLTGGDSGFYGLLYNALSGDLNTYNSPGLYSAEYTGTTNRPGSNNGHYIQISDAGGTDVKTQWYFANNGSDIYMRLMWGNGNWLGWKQLMTTSNYNSYAPTLTGGGASGTWSINITGSAGSASTATNATQLGGYAASTYVGKFGNTYYQADTWIQCNGAGGLYWPAYNAAEINANTTSSYGSVAILGSRNTWRGIHFQGGGYTPHLMFDGSANGGIYYESYGRWASYYNYNDNCWGYGTSTTSSAYNIYCPTGVYSGGRVDGTIFYDSDNTGYYLDPAGTSNLNGLTVAATISGSINGNAATASNASLLNSISAVNLYNNMGGSHFTRTSFDAAGAASTVDFGYRYVQGSTNGPGVNSASQYYSWFIGLGSEYAYNSYGAQFALPRNVSVPYLTVRYEEGGSFGAWQKIAAGYADSAGSAGSASTATTATYVTYGIADNTDSYMNFRVMRNANSSASNDGMYIGYSNSNSGVTRIFGGGATSGEMIKYAGYTSEPGSFRAPIFYDLDNTGYYADPASTSNFNALSVVTINNLHPLASSWHSSNEGQNRFFFASGSTTYYGTGNNFVWRNASDAGVLTVDSSGNLRTTTGGDNYASYSLHVGGTGYAVNDFRAPIFYDSDNTGYYVDPAGTSNLNGLTVGGSNWTGGLGAGYNYVPSSTDPAYRGNFGAGVWAYSGFSTGSDRPFTYDATLQVMPTGGLGFEISADWVSQTSTPLKVRSLRDCCQGWSSWTDIATSGVSFTNNVDLRAPIFYDSNNTGYYVDPASGSNFNYTTTGDSYTNGWFRNNNSSTGLYNQATANHWYSDGIYWNVAYSGTTGIRLRVTGHAGSIAGYFYGDTSLNSGLLSNDGNWRVRTNVGYQELYGTTYADDTRSNIYYDRANTGYYADPASTSNFYRLDVAGYNVGCSATIDLTGYDQSTYYPVGIALSAGQTTTIKVNVGLNSGSAPSWSTHPGGFTLVMEWQSVGSGWGTTTIQRSIKAFTYGWASVNPCGGISQNSQASMEFVWLRGGGRYYIQVVGLDTSITAYTSGYSYGGQTDNPTTGTVNDVWSSASGSGTSTAIARAISATYSPIFYDLDNTGYYVDPASTTQLNVLNTAGNIVASGNVTAYSDENLKADWAELPADYVDRLAFVKHGTYTRVDTNERHAGASAQDMQKLLSETVLADSKGVLSLAYGNAALVSAIKLAQRILELEARLQKLETAN